MAVNIGNAAQAGLLSQQYPPPLLPKPGKENVRLQKLLKKTAKKKAASQASQTPVPFRSSLSPVNEASPDLEHSDHSTPPRTPETPIYGGTLHPRFNVRPLYQHIASPYPHQRSFSYGKPTRFSPQPFVPPGLSPPHHMAPLFSYSAPSHSVPLVTVTSVAAITTTTEFIRHADIKPGSAVKQVNNVVLTTQLESNSSLTPTFTTSKQSKPMFDVPQITNYTSKTASLRTYYTASPKQERSKTPLAEIKRSQTPTFEVRRIVTPTSELKRERTPTREIRRGPTPTSEIKRGATPTFEIKRGPTPTSEIRRGPTPTAEIKRGLTPTSEIKRGTTPTSEVKRGSTPTPEVKRGPTPTPEMKKIPTTTLEVKNGTTQTSEIRGDATVKTETTRGRTPTRERTPTLELTTTKTLTGRPKTPSYHVSPARTPVIEISRPNPLLFAVSPVHMEGRRSKTPTSSLLGPSDETPKESSKIPEAIQNGDVQIKPPEISADKKSSDKIKEPELPKPKIPTQDAPKFTETSEPQGQMTPSHESSKPVPTAEFPSPKPPNHEFDKPVLPSPGLQRPRIPPFAGQRPRTPTSKSPKSTYYGLTPAEYVAHGGIQSFTPAFGISRPISPTTAVSKPPEPVSQEPTQNAQGKAKDQSTLKEAARPEAVPKQSETPVSKVPPSTNAAPTATVSEPTPTPAVQKILKSVKETPKLPTPEIKKTEEKVSAITIPTIVVSKADTPPAEVPQAVTTVPVTPRVRTPTYGPPKPKSPPSDSTVEPTKPETKPASAPAQTTTSNQTADVAKISKPTPAKDAVTAKTDKVSKKPSAPQKSLLERIKEQKSLTTVASDKTATEKTQDKPLVKPADDQKDKVKPEKKDLAEAKESTLQETKPAAEEKGDGSSPPAAEPLLKAFQKPKGMKSKLSGWSRLKKHMVVEVEEPTFPDAETALKKEAPDGTAPKPSEQKPQGKEADKITEKSESQEDTDSPRAAKMWDAVLFQMFSTKESIMQQIEASKTDEQKKEEEKLDKPKEIPSFAHRLPVLLYSPRFDARKLREAASRPVTKIATVFEMGLIGRKGKDEEPKDFNRTAKGFAASKSTDV
ncbi:proteoglycan 4-like [Astyanax mexicanus]|uniref:Proline rich 33 n=1 Tax=Astyanax mexicanus TaxID=7994 RepID=A0A8B9R632_ASTMX|nr:proteoglycan 4-like [Astyanax mexicanus]